MRRGAADTSTSADEPLQLLVQGMRQLQQAYMGKNDSKDVEFKGSIEVPPMPDVGAEASVAFADWLYELEQAVGALSDKASVWFTACLDVARQAYLEYTMASPLTRISLQPRIPESLKDPKWARLDRRVMTLLLGAMKRPAKEDAITHRIGDVPSLLFRLHVLYQPGGTSERAAVLKHLEGKLGGDDVHECVAALRKWRRYLERAESMHVTVPDPSILLGAVELMVKKVMTQYPEVKFRTDLMKNELQLQGRPTLEGVLRLHTHILAELQMVAPVSSSSLTTTLKAIGTGQAGTGEASSAPSSPNRKGGSKAPCKFFLSKSGCSRGSGCKFEHVFESREDKKTRVKELLKEANAMLSKLTKLQALEVQTNHSVGELTAAIRAAGLEGEEGFALLDTGASHAFKTADRADVDQAHPVRVELAGGQYVTLKQNKAGTLLAAADDPGAANASPILPLGALVQKLGCELTWTRKGGLKVIHPQFGVLRTFVKGNHPMLAETQALEIIAQLEEQQLKALEGSTAETFIRSLDYEEMKSWDFMLGKFVATGGRDCLLDALCSPSSPLGHLPQHVLALAAVQVGLDDKQGWKYLKALPLNRKTRKAMMTKRWIVRLYRREGEADLQVRNSENAVTVDCNVARSKRFSMKGDSATYKALMWAAARGQLEGVLGSPPVNDAGELLAKQLLIWTVARQGSSMHGFLPPYLLLGSTPASSMWRSEMWETFRQEYHLPMMQVESQEDGANYLVATNLAMKGGLLASDSVEVPEGLTTRAWPNIWKLPFQYEVGLAVDRWRLRPDEMFLGYMLHKLDSEAPWSEKDLRYWRRRIANGHLPFDRRCRTCIQTAATGRAHRRVIAPSCYTLSLDVCGPFRKKGEYGGSRGFRYALIGTYLMPKLTTYKDVPIPEEPDLSLDVESPEEDFLEEQGPADPPVEPADQEDLDKSNEKFQALYKEIGDTMEYQTLHYAVPLKTRLMPEVEDAVKHIYLQIRSEGLPVTRVHSDRARELRGGKLRAWLLHRDVLPTTGEAQAPQTNGRAEAGVKRVWTDEEEPLLDIFSDEELAESYLKAGIMGTTLVLQLFEIFEEVRLPNVTKFLAKFAREFMGAKQFATVVIQRNGGGGGLWTQLEDGEVLADEDVVVTKEVKPGHELKGKIIEASKGQTFSFDPMGWHEVQAHSGERIMVIAYTPRLSNFDTAEAAYLESLGFLPFGEEEGVRERASSTRRHGVASDCDDKDNVTEERESTLLTLNEAQQQLLEDLHERSRSLRLLLEEEQALAEDLRQAGDLVEEEAQRLQQSIAQMLQRAADSLSSQDRAVLKVCLKAAGEAVEPDYEQLLESLEGDLQVVHTAIQKELDNLFKGGTLVEIDREEALRLERAGALRLVPSKGVHTLKPPGSEDVKFKRKYRLVLCGNFVAPEEQFGSLYAGGASAETFRTVLASTAHKGWLGAAADITGAFLLAPWPGHLHRYAVVPPRLLVDNNYVPANTFWLVLRPLYGLRESPAIWAAHRSARFSSARIFYKNKYLVLKMSKVDPELWFVFFEGEDDLLGCVITYVDDLFYVAESEVVTVLHTWILEEWPCSGLEWASAAEGTRYLGMEVSQRPSGAYEIHQRGYILDLLRSHDMLEAPGSASGWLVNSFG
ncbi:GIP [Symbiodinium pilosum]|uniref:GIP protein n=1 Tax=Symbiodinium pilosum TaxID=2952 RepID=A0A812P1A5_SYMPI|nr:GIP [Symbiodinium pilosum]